MRPSVRKILLIVLCCGLGLIVLGCRHRSSAPPKPIPPKESVTPIDTLQGATINGEGYRIVFPENGPRVWVAEAKSVQANADNGVMQLRGVSCELYRQGEKTLLVTADVAQAALAGNVARITLTGHVQAREPQRAVRLDADHFRWVSNSDVITATGIRWRAYGLEHRAAKGQLSTNLRRATFTGQITTETIGVDSTP